MKVIELNRLYSKCTGMNFDVEMLLNGLKEIGLYAQRSDDANRYTPEIQDIVDIEQGNDKNKWDDEFHKDCGWDIVEKQIVTSDHKPTQVSTRLVGRISFSYDSKYNCLINVRLQLIDSNVWNIYIDGGDGDTFECMKINELYFLPKCDDVYTDLSFGSYMDFESTDGANFTSIRLENNLSIDNLFDAVIDGDIQRIKSLIVEGKNINEKNKNGETALMVACHRGDLKIINVLLELGSDKTIKDNDGKIALDKLIWREQYIMKDHVPQTKKDTFKKVKESLEVKK